MEPSSSSSTGDEEGMEQTMRGPEQSVENLVSSEPTLANRQCRICYAPQVASGADPILRLECACKGDISCGHKSCLKKWFRKRFQRNGNPNCEICRNPLGTRLKEIIWSFITAEVIQHAPRLLLLLQVSPDDLDHLQVPLETPGFYQLPSETRRSLEAFFERLEREQRRSQSRRRVAFETAQSIAAHREPSDVLYEEGDYLRGMPVDETLVNNFLEISDFVIADPDPRVHRMFAQHPYPSIDTVTVYQGDEYGRFAYPEGCVIRVPILGPEDIVHPSPVEDLLDEVSTQAARIVDIYGEDLILLPNFMDKLYLEIDGSLDMSVSEIYDNNDHIPFASAVLNRSSGGRDPVFAEAAPEAARRTDSIPRRMYTYGRFQMFRLLQ